jgi:predicted RNase H-like HicB family nuclease
MEDSVLSLTILQFAMNSHYILTDYVDRAIAEALYDKLDDGSFAGSIASCKGVLAFGATLKECEAELRSTLEDWILVGLKLGHSLPVVDVTRS